MVHTLVLPLGSRYDDDLPRHISRRSVNLYMRKPCVQISHIYNTVAIVLVVRRFSCMPILLLHENIDLVGGVLHRDDLLRRSS